MILVGTFAYCCFFFSMAGLQFWSSFYIQTIYGVSKGLSFILYISISITACLTGIFFGGKIVDKLVRFHFHQGGYDRDNWRRTSYVIMIFGFFSFFFGALSCIQWNIYFFGVCAFLCVSCLLATAPGSAGMVLTSLEPFD